MSVTAEGIADQTVASFRERLAAAHRHTELARHAIEHTTGASTSADGALADAVLAQARLARADVLQRARAAVADAVGEDNEVVAALDRRLAQLRPSARPTTDPSSPAGRAEDGPAEDEPDAGRAW